VQSYHNISKNAIKSQPSQTSSSSSICAKLPQYFKECNQVTTNLQATRDFCGAKLPQYFKECNQVTTAAQSLMNPQQCKVTTIFQRMQSSHNILRDKARFSAVQSYHNISKNAIKSQHNWLSSDWIDGAKLPQYFKECNQVTTRW